MEMWRVNSIYHIYFSDTSDHRDRKGGYDGDKRDSMCVSIVNAVWILDM